MRALPGRTRPGGLPWPRPRGPRGGATGPRPPAALPADPAEGSTRALGARGGSSGGLPCGSARQRPRSGLIVPHYFRLSSARMSQALRFAANALWPLLRAYNTRFERPSPHPTWAPAPLLKKRERTFPPLGWPRETDSLCPRCVKEVRTAILDGTTEVRTLIDGQARRDAREDPREGRRDRHDQDVRQARHLRGRDLDRPRTSRPRIEDLFPGRDFVSPPDQAPRPRHVEHQVRARRGAHGRPDQPLQHDVRPLLHGRQPGRLRARARVGRGAEHPRRLGQRAAAAADERPVLRRRADAVAALPARDHVREGRRVLLRAVRDQRHPLRAGPRASPREAKASGLRLAYLQFDGVGRTRPTRTARSATSSR